MKTTFQLLRMTILITELTPSILQQILEEIITLLWILTNPWVKLPNSNSLRKILVIQSPTSLSFQLPAFNKSRRYLALRIHPNSKSKRSLPLEPKTMTYMARVTNHSRSLNFKNKRKNLNFRPKSANLHSLNNPLSNKTQIKKRINCLKALEMKNLETLQVVSTISLGTNPWKGKAEIRAIMKNSQKSTSMIIRLQLLQELKITPLKSMLKRRKPS